MEKLIFSNKYLKTDYSFDESINQLSDASLIKILQKENYKNEDCGLVVSSLKDLPVSEFIQIKVNVSNVGVFLVNFEKESISDEDRKKLLEQISTLKTKGELSDEEQLEKIKKLVLMLNDAKPAFITFLNNQHFQINEETIRNLFKSTKLNTYLFLLSKPKEVKTKVVKEHKHIHLNFSFLTKLKKHKELPESNVLESDSNKIDVVSNKNQETAKVAEGKLIEVISFKDYLEDNLFFGIFALMIPFSFILGLVMLFNNNSLCAFLFVLSGLFFAILIYASYEYINEFKKWSFDFQKIKYPVLVSLLGLIIGIGVGFVIGYFAIKPAEGVTINYPLILTISIPGSLGLVLLGHIAGYLLFVILNKVKKNKKQK